MECLNCKRIIVKEIAGKRFPRMLKICPWCVKPMAPRQSNRKTPHSARRK